MYLLIISPLPFYKNNLPLLPFAKGGIHLPRFLKGGNPILPLFEKGG
jgi:hypothetical protein